MVDRIQRKGSAALIAALSFCIIALAIGYFFVIALPRQGHARVAAVLQLEELRQASEREREVNDCLVSAYRSYSASWQLSCEKMERSLGCLLPTRLAAALTEGLEKTQELCVKKYK
jgi:hypothetical protein